MTLLCLLLLDAGAQERFTGEVGTTVYVNDDDLSVVSPWGKVSQAVGEEVDVNVGYTADVISAASVDVITAATAPFRETRNEAQVGVALDQTTRRASLNAIASLESDTHAYTFAGSGEAELLDRNLTLGLAYGLALYRVGTWQQPPELWDPRTVHEVNATASQVLGRRTIASATYTLQQGAGRLDSPYHLVPVFPDRDTDSRESAQWVAEEHPDARTRHALGITAHQALSNQLFLSGSWRGYVDTWAMRAHTGELVASADLGGRVIVEASDRVHWQSSTGFYRSVYTVNRTYITADRRMGKLVTNIAGVAVRPRGEHVELVLKAELHWTHYADHQGLVDDVRTPTDDVWAVVGQTAVRVSL